MFTEEELAAHRRWFPVTKRFVYLDHAAVSPASTPVRAAMDGWMAKLADEGLHSEVDWEERIDATRASIAALIGAETDEIAFVRSTSQGIAIAAEGIDWRPGDEVLLAPSVEYPANVFAWKHLARRGVIVRELPAPSGTLEPQTVRAAISSRTRALAVSSVQFATGALTDLPALAAIADAADAIFVVDGIQSVGAVPLDVGRDRIQILSVDSHKWLLGIMGIGFLRIARPLLAKLTPAIVGWRSTVDPWAFDGTHFELRTDASRFEEGSLPYPMIAGLDAAVRMIAEVGVERISLHIAALLSRLEALLDPELVEVSPPPLARGPFVFVSTRRTEVEAVHRELLRRDFRLSLRRGRLRIAPHLYTHPAEIERLAAALNELSRPG